MTVFIIIFMCVAMLMALSSIALVANDVIMEMKGIEYRYLGRKNKKKKAEKEEPVAEPVVTEPVEVPMDALLGALLTAEAAEEIAEEPAVETVEEPLIEIKEEIEVIEEPEEPVVEEEPVELPLIIEEPEIEEILPEIVEHVDAEVADTLISDYLAIKKANYAKGAGKGRLGVINIGDIDAVFEADSVVTLEELKEMKLLPKGIGRLKVLAHGSLNKPLTVKAESYSVQAIKMIELTGGTVIILKD